MRLALIVLLMACSHFAFAAEWICGSHTQTGVPGSLVVPDQQNEGMQIVPLNESVTDFFTNRDSIVKADQKGLCVKGSQLRINGYLTVLAYDVKVKE